MCHTTHTHRTHHKNGPRRVITCSRGTPKRNHWKLSILSLRRGREQHVPDSSNHSLYLMKLFDLSFAPFSKHSERFERQYRHEPPPEFSLTLPFSSLVHHLSSLTLVLLKPLSRSQNVHIHRHIHKYFDIHTSCHQPSRTQPEVERKGGASVLCVM